MPLDTLHDTLDIPHRLLASLLVGDERGTVGRPYGERHVVHVIQLEAHRHPRQHPLRHEVVHHEPQDHEYDQQFHQYPAASSQTGPYQL